jgi:hypothetical protein
MIHWSAGVRVQRRKSELDYKVSSVCSMLTHESANTKRAGGGYPWYASTEGMQNKCRLTDLAEDEEPSGSEMPHKLQKGQETTCMCPKPVSHTQCWLSLAVSESSTMSIVDACSAVAVDTVQCTV